MKKIKLGPKLMGGFLIVALLCAYVGYEGIRAMEEINEFGRESAEVRIPSLIGLDLMNEGQTAVQRAERGSLFSLKEGKTEEYRHQTNRLAEKWQDMDKGWNIYAPLPQTPEEARVWQEFVPQWDQWKKDHQEVMALLARGDLAGAEAMSYGETRQSFNKAEALLGKLIEIQQQVAKENQQAANQAFSSTRATLWTSIAIAFAGALLMGFFLTRSITRPLQQVVDRAEELQRVDIANLGKATEAMARGDLSVTVKMGVQPLKIDSQDETGILAQSMNGIIRQTEVTVASFEKGLATLRGVVEQTNELIEAAREGKLSTRGQVERFEGGYREMVAGINGVLEAVVTPIGEASAVLEKVAARDLGARMKGDYQGDFAQIKESINTAVQNLDESMGQVGSSSEQVSSAAGQISSGSQSLAEGASEQASSLEEISSALEEIASMTRQNADNSDQAKTLAQSARSSADKGLEAVERMNGAIGKIKASSDETAKIVKTIDEIAFQTNLLALNAAVEAARAGEAGKGFAVVAEEVRNLAQRSAEAAKTTADMIEASVRNADEGVKMTEEVTSTLGEITEGSRKVSDLVAEIAAASKEQSQGIEQVNTAVGQLDKVTQQNAANAEESASAAEELNGQAEELQAMVGTFTLSAGAKAPRKAAPPTPSHTPAKAHTPVRKRELAGVGANGKGHGHGVKPSELIPLEDDEELRSF